MQILDAKKQNDWLAALELTNQTTPQIMVMDMASATLIPMAFRSNNLFNSQTYINCTFQPEVLLQEKHQ